MSSIPEAKERRGISFAADDAITPGDDSTNSIRHRRPDDRPVLAASGKSMKEAALKAAEMGYLTPEDCDGKEPDGDDLLRMFRSNPEALHGILEAVRTGRLNEHLHQENRMKGGYIWVLLVSTLGMIAINTGVIFGALNWNKEIVVGSDGQLYDAHGNQGSVLIRNQAAPPIFTGVSLVGPPLAQDAVEDSMCGDPSMIPSLAGGKLASPEVQHCVLDPSLTCTFCDTCDGDLFQTFQLQTVSVRVPEYDMATGTVTALAPSTDLTTIDGTYLSGHIQYLHDNSLESDFLYFCDAEKQVCYEILANCWGWYCQQAQGGTATFCASRRERQRQLKETEEREAKLRNLKLTNRRRLDKCTDGMS